MYSTELAKGTTVIIVDNIADHEGYNGEQLKVTSIHSGDFYTVSNDNGGEWFAGIEELQLTN